VLELAQLVTGDRSQMPEYEEFPSVTWPRQFGRPMCGLALDAPQRAIMFRRDR